MGDMIKKIDMNTILKMATQYSEHISQDGFLRLKEAAQQVLNGVPMKDRYKYWINYKK